MTRVSLMAAGAATALLLAAGPAAAQREAICYNCPPEWADWASMLEAIQANLGISLPHDNKNSGQTLAQLLAERDNPVADVAYYGVTFGIQAADEGVAASYQPAHGEEIPEGLYDPDWRWFTIHYGTLGFFVNTEALGDIPVPQSFADLLDPQYEGMVGYLDPTSAFVGYAGAVAANLAMGGTLDDFGPGLEYFAALQENDPIVPLQTSYARVLSGEIPILFDYDFNAYRAIYDDEAPVEFVIPAEGTIVVPYVMSLVAGAPHEAEGREILDFIMSDEGQAIWANAYLRPVREAALSEEVAARFLPAEDYARAHPIDYGRMAEVQADFVDAYRAAVQ
ncbi:MAG: ABC transporter substrate-binding protein [Rhodospirillaceae bacterium]|nr:ABC transporter substrate-binding protein [Rhodospirillaceae bacterium]